MKISELITERLIIPQLEGKTKNQVLEELVKHLTHVLDGVEADELLKVLIEREKLGSTGIGNGIAIPHGKLSGLSDIVLVFGKSIEGVPFDAIDGKPVHLVFLLVAPADSAGGHLKALARLSRLLKNEAFRSGLMDATDAQGVYRIIVDEDGRISA